jgi:hypothetical protein
MGKVEYWTMFKYGDSRRICSKHRTAQAAHKAATKCERSGGSEHQLLEVTELTRVPYKRA